MNLISDFEFSHHHAYCALEFFRLAVAMLCMKRVWWCGKPLDGKVGSAVS